MKDDRLYYIHLSEDFKANCSKIEWYKIAGLRNNLVHDYLDIDLETVRVVVTDKLSELKTLVIYCASRRNQSNSFKRLTFNKKILLILEVFLGLPKPIRFNFHFCQINNLIASAMRHTKNVYFN